MNQILSSAGYQKRDNVWMRPSHAANFTYSDGDEAENRLLKIVEKATDTSLCSPQLAAAISDWASYYHLSNTRSNLMRPIRTMLKGPILEIGAGCGAITRFLGEEGHEVVALEGSYRRSQIIGARCRDLPNVSVLAEPFQDFAPDMKFATITLIGVLEYARVFGNKSDKDAVDLMLEKAKSMLHPGGVLIIAIENQLGLKYLSGYSEDHLGRPMLGIEDQYTASTVVTFGKRELTRRVVAAGFTEQQFWFPFPDYKLPVFALSDRALADDIQTDFAALIRAACQTDFQKPAYTSFMPELAWDVIARNGLQGELANSFLLVASAEAIPEQNVVAYHYSAGRNSKYMKSVEFTLNNGSFIVNRVPLYPDRMDDVPGTLSLLLESEVFENGKLWRDVGYRLMMRNGWSINELSDWLRLWLSAFQRHLQDAGENIPAALTDTISGRHLDALPRNLIVDDGKKSRFIDQEWVGTGEIEFGFILFRSIWDLICDMQEIGEPSNGTSLQLASIIQLTLLQLGFSVTAADLSRYYEMEVSFREAVIGKALPRNASIIFRSLRRRMNFADVAQHAKRVIALESQVDQLRTELEIERNKSAQMLRAVNDHLDRLKG